jgi:hypothetical protein
MDRKERQARLQREEEGYTPSDGVAWSDARHSMSRARLLTDKDPRAIEPPHFRGELYAPQQTMLAAMLALEARPYVAVGGFGQHPTVVQTRVARVSERFSFGKTVLALALVCTGREPAHLPEPLPLFAAPARPGGRTRAAHPQGTTFLPELTVTYERYLPATVVVAAASVISQWEANARRFTDLRYVTVENVHSLREFEASYHRDGLAGVDLIFVKAGRVTARFSVPGEPPAAGRLKNRALLEALARVLDGVPVARLLVDDYDTLKLGGDDCFLPAHFTWLISATRRQTTLRGAFQGGNPTRVEEYLRAHVGARVPILLAAHDEVINHVFSIHCAPEYVDAHLHGTEVAFRRILVRGGLAAAILRDLEVPDEVVEMINADAVSTAAAALGLNASSIGDVIRRVVGDHLDKLRQAARAAQRAAALVAPVPAPTPASAPTPTSEPTSTSEPATTSAPTSEPATTSAPASTSEPASEPASEFEPALDEGASARDGQTALIGALKRGTDAELALAVRGASPRQRVAAAATVAAWAEEQRAQYGKTLGRMRDNIREGQCQCCMVPFERGAGADADVDANADAEAAYVLAGCCQIIVCEPCITREEDGRRVLIRRCPNCARDLVGLNRGEGLVRVGVELDLEAALGDDALGAEPRAPDDAGGAPAALDAPASSGAALDALEALDNPKLRALVQLVRGGAPDCISDERVPPFVRGLLAGRRAAPWPADAPRKYLVFTMHAESTRLVAGALGACAVPFCVLRGARAQKDEAVAALRGGAAVMLVTAARDCAGLDLPFISHVIFYHRVHDRHVEAQVAARGARLGRQHDLEIVALANEAEAAELGA